VAPAGGTRQEDSWSRGYVVLPEAVWTTMLTAPASPPSGAGHQAAHQPDPVVARTVRPVARTTSTPVTDGPTRPQVGVRVGVQGPEALLLGASPGA
jgi:hypothetical protein